MDLNLHVLLPEIVVSAAALLAVAADLLSPPGRRAAVVPAVAGAGLLLAFLFLLQGRNEGRETAVLGHFVSDAFSRFAFT